MHTDPTTQQEQDRKTAQGSEVMNDEQHERLRETASNASPFFLSLLDPIKKMCMFFTRELLFAFELNLTKLHTYDLPQCLNKSAHTPPLPPSNQCSTVPLQSKASTNNYPHQTHVRCKYTETPPLHISINAHTTSPHNLKRRKHPGKFTAVD